MVGFFFQPCKATPVSPGCFNYLHSLGDSQEESGVTIGLPHLNTVHIHSVKEMFLRKYYSIQQILKLFNKSGFIFYVLLLLQRPTTVAKRGNKIQFQHMEVNKVRCQSCSAFLSCRHFISLITPFESISELAFSNRAMGTAIT